jgi:hypothetical protein
MTFCPLCGLCQELNELESHRPQTNPYVVQFPPDFNEQVPLHLLGQSASWRGGSEGSVQSQLPTRPMAASHVFQQQPLMQHMF